MLSIEIVRESKDKLISELKQLIETIKTVETTIESVNDAFDFFIEVHNKKGTDEYDENEYWEKYRAFQKKYINAIYEHETIKKTMDLKMKLVVAVNDVLKPKHRNPEDFERYIDEIVRKQGIDHFEAVVEYCKIEMLEPESITHLVNGSLKKKIQCCCEAQHLLINELGKTKSLFR